MRLCGCGGAQRNEQAVERDDEQNVVLEPLDTASARDALHSHDTARTPSAPSRSRRAALSVRAACAGV
jgi:hypothetical protein